MAGISVIIPAYNGENFIGAAIDSVLNQSHQPLEIIVIDDGSTDKTAHEVKRFSNVTYRFQHHQGTAVASNAGVAHAKGEYFAFLDADDLWMRQKLERQKTVVEKDPAIDLQFSWIENFMDDSLSENHRASIEFNPRPMVGIQKSTLFIRRDAFFKVGLFTPASAIDLLDWYARSKEINIKEHLIEEVLVRRRIHGTNQGIVNKSGKSDFPKILKGILDRRRGLQ